MEQHLCHAVVDGPDGHHAIALPSTQDPALLMKHRHSRRFWCSRLIGGCGARLFVIAGAVLPFMSAFLAPHLSPRTV